MAEQARKITPEDVGYPAPASVRPELTDSRAWHPNASRTISMHEAHKSSRLFLAAKNQGARDAAAGFFRQPSIDSHPAHYNGYEHGHLAHHEKNPGSDQSYLPRHLNPQSAENAESLGFFHSDAISPIGAPGEEKMMEMERKSPLLGGDPSVSENIQRGR